MANCTPGWPAHQNCPNATRIIELVSVVSENENNTILELVSVVSEKREFGEAKNGKTKCPLTITHTIRTSINQKYASQIFIIQPCGVKIKLAHTSTGSWYVVGHRCKGVIHGCQSKQDSSQSSTNNQRRSLHSSPFTNFTHDSFQFFPSFISMLSPVFGTQSRGITGPHGNQIVSAYPQVELVYCNWKISHAIVVEQLQLALSACSATIGVISHIWGNDNIKWYFDLQISMAYGHSSDPFTDTWVTLRKCNFVRNWDTFAIIFIRQKKPLRNHRKIRHLNRQDETFYSLLSLGHHNRK